MRETSVQRQLPQEPALRDRIGRVFARPPLRPDLETSEERELSRWIPRDGHAEQCILGACLLHKSPEPITGLEPSEFFFLYHQRLATAILDLAQRNRPVNLQTLHAFLNADIIAVPQAYLVFLMAEYLRDVRNQEPGETP